MDDREAMLKKLGEMGVDCSLITEAMPDNVLAEWLRSVDDRSEEKTDDDQQGSEEEYDDEADPADEMDDAVEDSTLDNLNGGEVQRGVSALRPVTHAVINRGTGIRRVDIQVLRHQ